MNNKQIKSLKLLADIEQTEQESVAEWMGSNRLFERYFFFYFLIIGAIGTIGVMTLGFEVSGFSAKVNLLANVVWVFILTLAMCFTPLWFRLLLGRRTDVLRDTQSVYEQLKELDEAEQIIAKKQLANNGKLPPSKLQFAAMVFIGWYFLFEFCIVTAFVDDNHHLIWEPQWVQSLIEWGIDNTRTPAELPPTKGGELKLFYADFTLFDFLKAYPFSSLQFSDEFAFLNSPLGHTAMFFSLWRVLLVIPVLITLGIAAGKMYGWLGLNRLNLYYTKGFWDFLRRLLFNILVSIFVLAPWYLIFLTNVTESMMQTDWWFGNLKINLGIYMLGLIPLFLIGGWFRAIAKLFRKLVNKAH